jgi:uncharacterized protein YkwD
LINYRFKLSIISLAVIFIVILSWNQNYVLGDGVIPSKIRDDGNYWIQGNIQDSDFAKDIQYLSIHGIIHIPKSNQSQTQYIPSWVKHIVGWWIGGKITDSELLSAVQWLINQNIILVGVSENNGAASGQNAALQTNTIQSVPTENNSSQASPQLQQLYAYALKLVNDDREKYGLSPVSLGNIASAQNHADDQLAVNYFSHWNSNGVKPYVTYTKLGGKGLVDENIFYKYTYCPESNCVQNIFDPPSVIQEGEYQMMYNDSRSNWGHRDNILDPNHTHVNFGIAYNNDRFYFVQNFENNIIQQPFIKILGNQLQINGYIPSGYSFAGIDVYSDPAPLILAGSDLNNKAPYNMGYYDQGTLAGEILPSLGPTMAYKECTPGKIQITEGNSTNLCIDYVTVSNTSNSPLEINLAADVSKWQNDGQLHTIYLNLKDLKGNKVQATSLTLEYLH